MGNSVNILIIDDEIDFCKLLALLFARDNYIIHCAHCLRDAKSHLQVNKPEIVLLDLPDGLGLDFLNAQPSLFNHSHVILVTADPSPLIKMKAFNSGVHFLGKPFELNKIKEMIKLVA